MHPPAMAETTWPSDLRRGQGAQRRQPSREPLVPVLRAGPAATARRTAPSPAPWPSVAVDPQSRAPPRRRPLLSCGRPRHSPCLDGRPNRSHAVRPRGNHVCTPFGTRFSSAPARPNDGPPTRIRAPCGPTGARSLACIGLGFSTTEGKCRKLQVPAAGGNCPWYFISHGVSEPTTRASLLPNADPDPARFLPFIVLRAIFPRPTSRGHCPLCAQSRLARPYLKPTTPAPDSAVATAMVASL